MYRREKEDIDETFQYVKDVNKVQEGSVAYRGTDGTGMRETDTKVLLSATCHWKLASLLAID